MLSDRTNNNQINADICDIVRDRLLALQRLKKRKKNPFKSKLSRYADEIFILRDGQAASFELIKIYLWKHHRMKTTKGNVRHFYLAIKNEVEMFNQSQTDDNYWGDVGSSE